MARRASSENLIKFTKTSVGALALQPGQSERKVWDSETPGLGVRLRASGAAYWVVRPPRKGGSSAVFTLGTVEAIPLATARTEAAKRIANVTLGIDVAAEREAAKARAAVTFGGELVRYLARAESRLRASSLRDVRRYLDVLSKPLHELPLAEIKRARVMALLEEVANPPAPKGKKKPDPRPYAANRMRAALSAFFGWCVGEGLIEANPVIGSNKLIQEVSRDRVLSDVELKAVWLATTDDDFGRIVRLLMLTGQRRDEVAAMRWSEVDIKNAVWSLPPERTKNKRRHDVPLSADVLELLASVPAREGRELLFGKRGSFSGFSKSKAEMDKRIGIKPWVLHDLRRSCASGMARLGVSVGVVEKVLNHASGTFGGIVGVYQRHDFADEKRAALNVWAEHIATLVRQPATYGPN